MNKYDGGNGHFVLGLASLHHLSLPAQRQRFLQLALELGVRHFDVAPAYGNGLNERELGIALRGRRHEVTIATKFGISFFPYGDWTRTLFLPLRMVDRVLPGYRKRQAARDYSPEALRASVDASLRRLQTDYLDCLLLHEPSPQAAGMDVAALVDAAGEMRKAGKVGVFGVAGEQAVKPPWPSAEGVEMIQAPLDTVSTLSFDGHKRAYFVYRSYAAQVPNRERSFESYVADLRNVYPNMDLLFATRSPERLKQLSSLIR